RSALQAIRTDLGALSPSSCPNEHDVAGLDRYARLLFPSFDVAREHGRARLEIRHALQPRHVDQDAPRQDAVLQMLDAGARAAGLARIRRIEAVVGFA